MATGEYLPPVVTRLTGEMGDFETMIAEAKALLKSLSGDAKVLLNIDTKGIKDAAAQIAALKASLKDLSGTVKVNTDGMGNLAAAAAASAAATRDTTVSDADAAKAEYLLAMAQRMRANTAKDAQKAQDALNGTTARAAGNLAFGLTANALHWIVAGSAELLAVTLPAMVALAAAMAVMAPAAQNAVQHFQALQTATSATGNMFNQTAGDVLGLGHALQTAQDAAQPAVYGILGSALEIAKSHMSQFGQAGLQVAQIMQTFAAKLAVEFGPGGALGSMTGTLLKSMVSDLTGLGQVLGNLLRIIGNFASNMPGLAEVLLSTLAGITGFIAKLTSSNFAGYLITIGFAFEELIRWSSLLRGATQGVAALVGWIGKLAGAMGAANAESAMGGLSKSLTDMAKGAKSWQLALVALAAIGLGILIDKLVTARDATQRFTDSLQQAVLKASNIQAFQTIASNMGQLQSRLKLVNQDIATTNWQGLQDLGYKGGRAVLQAVQSVGELHAGMSQQQTDFNNVAQGAALVARTYGTTLVGAMALADMANVKLANGITGTSQQAQIARLQIASLVAGYQAMGAPLSAVGSDMTALAIQSGLASTKVSALNQAWDQFMQNLTGGTSGLANLNQELANLTTGTNNVTTVLGKAKSVTLTIQDFANSLKTFSGNGAQAWQNFNQVVGTTAPQLIDWMRTAGAEGALSGQQFQQGVLDMVSALVPLASQSQIAQSEVLGLVHQVAPSITTWGQLTQAIKNSHASLSGLGPIIGDATKAMGNMSQVAQNLGTATQTALLTALSSAKVMASGVGTAMQQYEQALMSGSNKAGQLRQNVLNDFAKMGIGAQQAQQIINAAIAGITSQKTINLTISTENIVSTLTNPGHSFRPTPTGYAAGTPGAAPGWAWVGEAGPELVKFRGGEVVVPNHVATGYAGGAGYDGVNHIHVHLDGREIYSAVQSRSVQTQRRTGHNGMTKRTR